MTAEVVLMNKASVAMAADSAVTISQGRSGFKTFHTVNKMFELKRGSGIGVMIYSNAEFNGVPWETVIKRFRQNRPGFHPHLSDYVDELLDYLRTDEAAPSNHDSAVITDAINQHTLGVFDFLQRRGPEWISGKGVVKKAPLNRIFAEYLDLFAERLESAEDPAWAADLSEHMKSGAHREVVREFVADMFKNFPLLPTRLNRLEVLLCAALSKCLREPSESGLVMAGFGQADSFPSMFACRVRGRVGGVVRSVHERYVEISLDSPSHIETFAQDEQAHGFLTGITKQVRSQVLQYWRTWSNRFAKRAAAVLEDQVPSIRSPQTRAKIAAAMADMAKQAVVDFGSTMAQHETDVFLGPMLRSVAVLPKDEVGTLASSLVNVTSLRQKMSISDLETVGGPVDCALISPGDGFVWLSRKHYFDQSLNPSWHLSHRYAEVATPAEGMKNEQEA